MTGVQRACLIGTVIWLFSHGPLVALLSLHQHRAPALSLLALTVVLVVSAVAVRPLLGRPLDLSTRAALGMALVVPLSGLAVTPFLDDPAILTLASGPAGQPYARLATGASVVTGEAYDDIDADMVDMETYAVVRAAARFGVPVMGLRGISDGKADLTVLEDWTKTLSVIDEGLAEALDLLKAEFERLTADLAPESA